MNGNTIEVEIDCDTVVKKLVGGLVASFCTRHWIGKRSVKAIAVDVGTNSNGTKKKEA